MGMKDKANELKDKAMEKAKQMAGDDSNVDKAADKLDGATGNKQSDHIRKAADTTKDKNDNLGE